MRMEKEEGRKKERLKQLKGERGEGRRKGDKNRMRGS